MERRKIIFATGNEGKMKEVRMLLADMDLEPVSLKEAGIEIDIVENGETFEENAIIKAKTIMELTGEMVLADDSGLEVDYLNGAPGVYSARYLGEDTPYAVKNKQMLEQLKPAKDEERTARFVSVIACAFPNGEVITVRGTLEGSIAFEEKGVNGFGYDPIFYIPEYDMTAAELPPEKKNEISHRGKALRMMKEQLKKRGI